MTHDGDTAFPLQSAVHICSPARNKNKTPPFEFTKGWKVPCSSRQEPSRRGPEAVQADSATLPAANHQSVAHLWAAEGVYCQLDSEQRDEMAAGAGAFPTRCDE